MPILVLNDKRYEFEYMCADFSNKEAMAVEKATGLSWQEFLEQAGVGVLATTALVWMCRRRAGENVAFSDVDFNMGDYSFELDEAQKRAAAEEAAEVEADENPTQGSEPALSGDGPEASPTPKTSTSSRSRKSSASTSGTTTG